jgi:hypothetical protein
LLWTKGGDDFGRSGLLFIKQEQFWVIVRDKFWGLLALESVDMEKSLESEV